MDRALSASALVVSLIAIAFSLGSRRGPDTPAAREDAAPSAAVTTPAPAPGSGHTPQTPSLSMDEARALARDAVAENERAVIERFWPRLEVAFQDSGRRMPKKPETLDGVLRLLLALVWGGGVDDADRVPMTEAEKLTEHCKNDLKQLGIYLCLFEARFKRYPLDVAETKRHDMLTDMDLLKCPFNPGENDGYEYLYPFQGDATPADAPTMIDRVPHPDGTRCVLFFQGRVDVLGPADYAEMMSTYRTSIEKDLANAISETRTASTDLSLTAEKRFEALKTVEAMEKLRASLSR